MSQNSHSLALFFDTPVQLKTAQLVYQYLAAGNTEKAQRWADMLGVADLAILWDVQWFNQQVSPAPTHLTLRFDTGTHDDLPLRALETLFAHGLRAAVLEVFYDQVGETERMHFDRGQWVSRNAFFAAHPALRAAVEAPSAAAVAQEEGAEDPYACSKDPAKPISVSTLRAQEEKRKREAQETAEAFVEMARAMGKAGKTGGAVVQGLMAVLLLRAAFKGLAQAVAFTVVTVLLFKGLWLWLGLGLVLAVVLPLYYIATEYKELRGDDGDGSEHDDEGRNGPDGDEPATVMARQ